MQSRQTHLMQSLQLYNRFIGEALAQLQFGNGSVSFASTKCQRLLTPSRRSDFCLRHVCFFLLAFQVQFTV